MLKYLGSAKILKKQNPRVDNAMFHLHYRVTFLIFIISSLLITAKEYFGSPINCYALKYPVPKHVLNTYCFIMSTYSVTKHNVTGPSVVYPGVGPHHEGDDIVYHSYYQWVPIVLFLQAVSFYFPRFLWKSFDGGLFSSVLMGLHKISFDEGNIRNKCHSLSQYLNTHLNMHRNFALRFFLCEWTCLLILLANLYLTDQFLGGMFLSYGMEIFKLAEAGSEGREDPMDRIFPRVTKCTFRKFGTSGNLESHDSLCVLAANILIVKIYIFLWYWMTGLLVITALWLVYRMAIIFCSSLRSSLLNWRGRLAGRDVVCTVGDKASLGDWFILYHIGRWMHPIDFAAFLRIFSRDLKGAPANPEPTAPNLDYKPGY